MIITSITMYILYLVEECPEVSKYETMCPNPENAGVDLVTAEDWYSAPSEVHLLNLGVKAMLVKAATMEPVHFWLVPRSSIYKTGYIMANSVGVIDSSYRGTLKAPVVSVAFGSTGFKAGARHFQIVSPDMGWIQEVRLVKELPETSRGANGFGSTG